MTAKSAKRKKRKILEDVQREIDEAAQQGHDPDDEFDPDLDGPGRMGGLLTPLGYGRKQPGEITVDKLLIGIKPAQGWYIKLSKEVLPNEFQFKKRILNFEAWADLELEIVNIVRAETENEYKKTGRVSRWGTGRYQLIFWNDNGVREPKPPTFIEVDAQEDMFTVPGTNTTMGDGAQNIQAVGTILEQLRQMNPTLDPTKMFESQNQAFMKGLEVSAGKEERKANEEKSITQVMMQMMMQQSQQTTQMIVGLMTAIMGNKGNNNTDPMALLQGTVGMMKDMKVIGGGSTEQKPFMEQIRDMQTLGLLKAPGADDEMSVINRMKLFASFIKDFSGAGPTEKPSLLEKALEIFGPKLPDMISNITQIASKAAEVKKAQIEASTQPSRTNVVPYPRYIEAQPGQPNGPEQPDLFEQPQEATFGTHETLDSAMPRFDTAAMDAAEQGLRDRQMATGTMGDEPRASSYSNDNRKQPQQPIQQGASGPVISPAQITEWKKELKEAVYNNNTSKFPYITGILSKFLGGEQGVLNLAQSGKIQRDDIVNYVLMMDKESYKDREKFFSLQQYIDSYLGTLLGNVIAECGTCHTEQTFNNEQEFLDEQGENNGVVLCGMGHCQGTLSLIRETVQ